MTHKTITHTGPSGMEYTFTVQDGHRPGWYIACINGEELLPHREYPSHERAEARCDQFIEEYL